MNKRTSFVSVTIGVILIVPIIPSIMLLKVMGSGVFLLLLGGFLILSPLFLGKIKITLGKYYWLVSRVILLFVVVSVIYMSVITVVMLRMAHEDSYPTDANVIVLGAALVGDKPDHMLQMRLDIAADYLKQHQQALCVVTGGYFGAYQQGNVMKSYLVSKGIDKNRIIAENKAENTSQNIEFSKMFLGDNKNVIIATSDFHQLRAKYFAKKEGLNAYALSASSPIENLTAAWFREYIAIIKAYVFNY